jgi:hypothetical protein
MSTIWRRSGRNPLAAPTGIPVSRAALGRFVRPEKGILILAPMVGNRRDREENAERNTDAKETQRTWYGFRRRVCIRKIIS